jgi:hypothetical protein
MIDFRNTKEVVEKFSNNSIYANVVNSMEYLCTDEMGMGGHANIISIWKY